jgi:plastocyanin domain-containing protein
MTYAGRVKTWLAFVILVASVPATVADAPKSDRKFDIHITTKGFEPDAVTVPARTPVTLVFTRTTDKTCTRTVVLTLDDGKKVERELPLDKPVEIAVTFPKAGKLGYACGMDMAKGVIVVQ